MKSAKRGKSEMTRRNFLRAASVTGAALAAGPWGGRGMWSAGVLRRVGQGQSAAVQISAAAPVADAGFAAARKVSEGIYAVISDTSKGMETLCNGGFVFGKDAAIVWEGYASPKGAAFQLETLAKITKVPVKAAIDSHYHFDHSFGNAQYAAAGIPIWAHAKVVPLLMERYIAIQNRDKTAFFAAAEAHARDPISDEDKQHAEQDLNTLKFLANGIDNTALALPNHSLEPSALPMKVDLGGREVVIETYPGHTPGDLILRVPDADVVFAGDLMFNHSYPVTFDADVLGWLKTLDVFSRYGGKTVFVPGHGAVHGQEAVELEKSVFADLAQHARQMAQMGVPVREAQARYSVPEQFKTLRLGSWGFCVDQAVAQFYQAAKDGKI